VSEATPFDVTASVGDAEVVVTGSEVRDGVLRVDVEIGGVDDANGIANFSLVTGDRRLTPLTGSAPGRCAGVTEAVQQCSIDFDVSSSEGSSRVLVLRRGDEQATWRLT
jgi:hypothetical protein